MLITTTKIDEIIKKIEQFVSMDLDRNNLEDYILQWSKLSYEWEEVSAWVYINYTLETDNTEYNKVYEYLIQTNEITEPLFFLIKQKFYATKPEEKLDNKKFARFILYIKNEINLYRAENIPLQIEESNLAKDYQGIMAGLTIIHAGKEYTLQQAVQYLEENNRIVRLEIWEKIYDQVFESSEEMNEIYSKMLVIRDKISKNAGFENYRDYTHIAKNRFDYSIDDCFLFHQVVEKQVMPVYNELLKQRQSDLKLETLRPYDLQVDNYGRHPLKPFTEEIDLIDKTICILGNIDEKIGHVLKYMKERGFLNLSSKKNKAPGGYNYPLLETGLSFIFMNAAGLHKDVITLLHESGHAFQSFLTDAEPVFLYRNPCMEVAELASMSMELISMEFWDNFYSDNKDLKKAKLDHLEDIIGFFPWMVSVDAYQQWAYTNAHTKKERLLYWDTLMNRFSGCVDWTDYEDFRQISWMRQSHIFTSPFYYIEYGIAQLGALQVWKNYLENPKKALHQYQNALSLGAKKSMREVYDEAGITFGFSDKLLSSMMDFIREQMDNIRKE